MGRKKSIFKHNYKFLDSLLLNDETFYDYLQRFEIVARSIFEWVNLPSSMNEEWLEKSLYYNGMACFLKDNEKGFINTNCTTSGDLNIYGIPTKVNCYSFGYNKPRLVYSGELPSLDEETRLRLENQECILIRNRLDGTPTCGSMELFAYRLYEAQRTIDTNINAMKTPVLLLVEEKQRLTMENVYNQYMGNQPVIFGDKNQMTGDTRPVECINTEAPIVFDKLQEYKNEIWNEALTFLGVNNISTDKKERLITDEANSNNELINLNLQSFLIPRKLACKQFNELFNLSGNNAIDVRVRSDLHNIIKQAESIVNDYSNMIDLPKEVSKWQNTQ